MPVNKPFELESHFAPSWEGRAWVDWGGSEVNQDKLREVGGFKFLSYHIFADVKCSKIRYSSLKSWHHRKTKLMQEIKTYDADILCLQDVDHYSDWWQPQLMYLGYDSIFKQRTDLVDEHLEGVLIAYKRDLFQLFKTDDVIFNNAGQYESALIERRCRTDDVGLIAFLQPWKPNYLDSALCVVSAMLSDEEPDIEVDVRFEQARYLAQCIESANRSYHLPVIIGMSMNDTPDSAAYHVLRTGRSQLMPKAPRQVPRPIIEPYSRNSVRILWKPPPMTEADPTILEYTVCWRPGGNLSIGYSLTKKAAAGDCIQYESSLGDDGLRRTVALEYRSMLITNLASETPFEFKVAATNYIGQGDWSRASEPYVLKNPPKASPKKPLKILKNLAAVKELCETLDMQEDDWNVHNAHQPNIYDQGTNLTPRTLDGKPDRTIATARVLPQSTNPRQGWKREMFGEEDQELKQELANPKRMLKSVIMDESGFSASVSDTASSKVASYELDPKKYHIETANEDEFSDEEKDTEKSASYSEGAEHEEESFKYRIQNDDSQSIREDTADDEQSEFTDDQTSTSTTTASSSVADINSSRPVAGSALKSMYGRSNVSVQQSVALFAYGHLESVTEASSWEAKSTLEDKTVSTLNAGGERARKINDDTIFDCKEAMEKCGAPNKRQVHSLDLRSAYESYGVAGEPLYTAASPEDSGFRGVACKDYIFFTARPLTATKLLSVPPLGKMNCDDPRESLICPDPYFFQPPKVFDKIFDKHEERKLNGSKVKSNKKILESDIVNVQKKLDTILSDNDGKDGSKIWGGKWVPFPAMNNRKQNSWLPNESYSSSHISLLAHFQINSDNTAAEWR